MTSYRYAARREDGTRVRGSLDASSGNEAAAVLSRRGLLPTRLREITEESSWHWSRPSRRAVANLFQSLATLVDAGVPLQQALVATGRVAVGDLKPAVMRVTARVGEGASLAGALDAEARLFGEVVTGLVRAGEQGIGLASGLSQAAQHLDREAETHAQIRAALLYPTVLLSVGTMSIGLIVFFIVPRFATLVMDGRDALPVATRALISVSQICRDHWLELVLGVLCSAAVTIYAASRYRTGLHRWFLNMPVLGRIRLSHATARVARTVGCLLGTGTPLLQALHIAARSVGDPEVAKRVRLVRERVSEGQTLTAALRAENTFTATATQLTEIGEQSGRLADLLLKASALEQQEAERRVRALVSVLEPALILLFAAIVAFVAAALLQAIYSIRPEGL
jgi:general secretion pathway protein F